MAKDVKISNSAKTLQLDIKIYQSVKFKIAIFTYFVVSSLCIFQLYVVLQRFFDKPIGTCVTVENAGTFKVPPFIICPTLPGIDEDDNYTDEEDDDIDDNGSKNKTKDRMGNNKEGSITNGTLLNLSDLRKKFKDISLNQNASSDSSRKISNDISAAWLNLTISNAKFSKKNCRAAVNRDHCLNKMNTSLKQEFLDRPTLISGICLKISQVEPLYYNQRSKAVKLLFKDEKDETKTIAIAFSDNLDSIHYLPFEAKLFKFNSLITIDNRRKYHYLNTKMNPCMSLAELRKCIDIEIEKSLTKLSICKLPFLKQFTRECGSIDDIMNSLIKVIKFFVENNVETCGRSCDVDSISYNTKTIPIVNVSKMVFEVTNNIGETIKEEYIYTLSAMMSDVAGNLGFYLGMSLFSVLNRPLVLLKNRFF